MKRSQNKNNRKVLPRLGILNLLRYIILIVIYTFYLLLERINKKVRVFSFLNNFLMKIIKVLDPPKDKEIPRVELIDLAVKNMTAKRNRFIVTVGGMTIGIAGIVFLLSIGYGLQALVISRVARLEEMRQADVSVLPGSNLYLNHDTLESFSAIDNVENAFPQIAVVGKVNYRNAATDMVVYGVTREYLEQSAIAPVIGDIFESNDLTTDIVVTRERIEKSTVEDEFLLEMMLTGEFVEIEGESDFGEPITISKVEFPDRIQDKYAVVNRAFLRLLSIDEREAVGETFDVSFISSEPGIKEGYAQDKIESSQVEYEIIGVTPDDITPLFYVPFIHLNVLGINNFSQVKIVVENERNLDNVRKEIETMGFDTSSVVDTVAQIDGVFSTLRIILVLLGTIALSVAALGMFNTLTVSLLERTREIGLLKAIGMKNEEVRDLFLAESMIMGFLGGLLGIIFGIVAAKLLELLISLYAIFQGSSAVVISDMPILFVLFIFLLSFLVGIFTGVYPARRATKISALNALRYE